MSTRRPRTAALAPREKILRAARRLLATKGFERISLRAVARSAQLAPSSIYEHFDGRDELLEAVAVSALRELHELIAVACSSETDAASQLLNAARTYLDFSHARAREFELVFSRPRPPEQVAPPAHSPLLPIVAVISAAVDKGTFAPNPGLSPLDMALSLWTQVHGIAVLRSRYLSHTAGFDEKAIQLVSASISVWSPRSERGAG